MMLQEKKNRENNKSQQSEEESLVSEEESKFLKRLEREGELGDENEMHSLQRDYDPRAQPHAWSSTRYVLATPSATRKRPILEDGNRKESAPKTRRRSRKISEDSRRNNCITTGSHIQHAYLLWKLRLGIRVVPVRELLDLLRRDVNSERFRRDSDWPRVGKGFGEVRVVDGILVCGEKR